MELNSLLEGKVALVTGANRGIGHAIAELLAAQGASIVLCSRAAHDVLKGIADGLAKVGSAEHMALTVDVADTARVGELYRQVFARYRGLDILVNNAGVMIDAPIGMISDKILDQTLAINVKGAITNLQAAARLMQRKKSGSIINISSIIGVRGNAGQAAYAASKAALLGLTLSAAKELAPNNIRVNAVAPGYIDTPMVEHYAEEVRQSTIAKIGLKRIGTPKDVAYAALYLASDWSSYVTGQVLGVDGGMTI
jgi:3-oxoacyl-[acyl-carrier protein] reductase